MTTRMVRRRTMVAALAVAACVVLAGCGVRGRATSGSAASTVTLGGQGVQGQYDPYAGTEAAEPARGRRSSGTLRTADGRTRSYRLYVPASLSPGDRVPLLVALHGGLGSAEQFEANSGFNGLAEANRFIVVYPDGIGALPNGGGPQTWNGGYCCGAAARENVDDVAFVAQLIATLEDQYAIDPARVYAAGHSNGAILAYRLACELSERIVAVGLQAGSLGVQPCGPVTPVSLFHLHGTADTNHPIDGGTGTGLAGVDFRSARSSVDAMVTADGCAGQPAASVDPSNPDVTATTWSPCNGDVMVRYVVVAGASHAWMGHPAASKLAEGYVGSPYPKLDASRAIWSFLAAQARR